MPIPAYPTATAVGSFRIPNPARPLQEGAKTNGLVFAADSGHEQRRKKGATKRNWDLNYPVLTQAQADTLFSFYLQVTTATAFTWIHPISKTQYTVRFTNDMLSKENFSHSASKGPLYKMAMKIEQVL